MIMATVTTQATRGEKGTVSVVAVMLVAGEVITMRAWVTTTTTTTTTMARTTAKVRTRAAASLPKKTMPTATPPLIARPPSHPPTTQSHSIPEPPKQRSFPPSTILSSHSVPSPIHPWSVVNTSKLIVEDET
jgi:hypothetical protein